MHFVRDECVVKHRLPVTTRSEEIVQVPDKCFEDKELNTKYLAAAEACGKAIAADAPAAAP